MANVTVFVISVIIVFLIAALIFVKLMRGRPSASQDVTDHVARHNRKEVNRLKDKKSTYILIGIIVLVIFPFLIPVAAIGFIAYVIAKENAKKNGSSGYNKKRHGDERFDHHEDECINCGTDFSDDVNEDCMFCGDGDNYDDDTEASDDFNIEKAFNDFGKNVSNFAKKSRNSYENSAWKPKVDKASGWLKEELTIKDKDTDEEAYTYSGTYDDVKEEAEGLKVLLRAGIIEKDEYNDRMAELRNRQ